jgi:nucleotide-binding universal stress UspA family protein
MPGPIIVAHEPARDDRAAVAFALAVARDSDVPVLAVSVVEFVQAAGRLADPRDREAAEAGLAGLRKELGVQTRVLVDMSVPHAIHRLAADEGAELIVVGPTGRGLFGRVLPGSTAERLIHGAHCAVALVPGGWTERPVRSVGVGFVDSAEGRAALLTAHHIARGTGARLRAISVLHPISRLDVMGMESPPERAVALRGRGRGEATDALDAALRELAPEAEPEIHVDDPADVLLHVSEHVDVLVCGSRGYGPLRGLVLGSVSRHVVDGARCPVIVVPRGVEQPLPSLLRQMDEAPA